ncbi:MAG: TIGR04086 family membrane protein [Acetobacter sp.]|nr:TIGR04086 family membrane protein [Acetobacter sp.]
MGKDNDDKKDEESFDEIARDDKNPERERVDLLADVLSDAQTELEKKLRELEKRLKESESHLVTVLGIFTAIVVTFVGTFAFSSSVLQNMEKGDIHRLIFVILCIAVFIASVLRWLFDFLLKISGKETKCFKWWWVGIVICFLIVGCVDWANYDYNTLPCKEKGTYLNRVAFSVKIHANHQIIEK